MATKLKITLRDLFDFQKMEQLRTDGQMTQSDAAGKAGMKSRQAWNNIEKGRRPNITLGMLCKIARSLNIQPRDLLRVMPSK